jgi:hypothetical protein
LIVSNSVVINENEGSSIMMPRAFLFLVFLIAILAVLPVAAQTPAPVAQPNPTPAAKYFVGIYNVPTPTEAEPSRVSEPAQTFSASSLDICSEMAASFIVSPTKPKPLDAEKIVALMGNPVPFSLAAEGKNVILIYANKNMSMKAAAVRNLKDRMDRLAGGLPAASGAQAEAKFTAELYLPHARVLGDVGETASKLNPDFKVAKIGTGRLRITSDKPPKCKAWETFIEDLRRLAWQISPESPVERLFYLNASADLAKAIGASESGGGGATPAPGLGGEPATPAKAAAGAAPPASPAVAAPTAGSGSAAPAGSKEGAATANPATTTPSQKADAGTSPRSTATAMAVGSDTLVFSDNTPGSDEAIIDKKRIIALLDLPRPEMIVNAWVMQNSSKSPQVVADFDTIVQGMVGSFNDALERAVFRGWQSIECQIKPGFFDPTFEQYITYRYIGRLSRNDADKEAQQILDLRWTRSPSKDEADAEKKFRDEHRICGVDEYCLGYQTLFHPLKPRLTDLLIAVVSAQKPFEAASRAVAAMEEHEGCSDNPDSDYCKELRSSTTDCRSVDLARMKEARSNDKEPPPIFLRCFLEKVQAVRGDTEKDARESKLGQLRTAIADFLFNYKLSQQYPHEFLPYELSRSADTLNAALSPFIEGFNADLKAYQDFLTEDLRYRIDKLPGSRGWFPWTHKESFVNNGIVSVRTISGTPTSLTTASQSFLDASAAPSLADLATAITSASPALGDDKKPTGVLGNLTLNEAQVVLGALKSYQSSSAQIGRGLSLDFTPRSLAAASASEITVTLKAEESAPPTYFSGPKAGTPADISRVSTHNTTTRVRVDSIKLFTISSYSAELRKSRSQIPLLPLPFIEVPYIHTLAGIPLPSAKEYHTSTAILSAIVVPTAADLAYGLAFINDRLRLEPTREEGYAARATNWRDPSYPKDWQLRKTVSLRDFRDQPILEFHRKKIACLTDKTDPVCNSLKFENVPRDADERQ